MTNSQKKELVMLEWFAPTGTKLVWDEPNDADIKKYFDWSERGIPHGENVMQGRSYFCKLYWGKSRRELHAAMWKQDKDRIFFEEDFTNEPKEIQDFFKRL